MLGSYYEKQNFPYKSINVIIPINCVQLLNDDTHTFALQCISSKRPKGTVFACTHERNIFAFRGDARQFVAAFEAVVKICPHPVPRSGFPNRISRTSPPTNHPYVHIVRQAIVLCVNVTVSISCCIFVLRSKSLYTWQRPQNLDLALRCCDGHVCVYVDM